MQVGETYIRRSVNAPAGTPKQREAWASATGAEGYNVCRIFERDRVYIRFGNRFGTYKKTNTEFDKEWERA